MHTKIFGFCFCFVANSRLFRKLLGARGVDRLINVEGTTMVGWRRFERGRKCSVRQSQRHALEDLGILTDLAVGVHEPCANTNTLKVCIAVMYLC